MGHADDRRHAAGPELITNASNFVRGYDPKTGRELWQLGGSSKITAPTPIFADGLHIIASGRAPERPVFAVKPGARGDLTLAKDETANAQVAWSKTGRGSYMPTPLAYRGLLYVLANNGVLDAYEIATGKEIYRQRLPLVGSGFSASPVAADGKIYLSNEDGEMLVVEAGAGVQAPRHELDGRNADGDAGDLRRRDVSCAARRRCSRSENSARGELPIPLTSDDRGLAEHLLEDRHRLLHVFHACRARCARSSSPSAGSRGRPTRRARGTPSRNSTAGRRMFTKMKLVSDSGVSKPISGTAPASSRARACSPSSPTACAPCRSAPRCRPPPAAR